MYEDASQIANDAVGSIRTVASFCAEEKVMQLYEEKCEGPRKAGIKEGLISGIGFGTSSFLLFSVYATSFYAGAQLIKHGQTSFSAVFRVYKPSITIFFFQIYFRTFREKNLNEIHFSKLSSNLFNMYVWFAGFLCFDHGSYCGYSIKLLFHRYSKGQNCFCFHICNVRQ